MSTGRDLVEEFSDVPNVYSRESYLQAKAEFTESHYIALEALDIFARAQRTLMSFEEIREEFANNENTAELLPIIDECHVLGKTMEKENVSIEDLFSGNNPKLTASLEAIRRGFFERLGKAAADAKKRVGESIGSDKSFFEELKNRHSMLADAIRHANNSQGGNIEFKCYALDSHVDRASLIKAAQNAASFYGNFNKNYQKVTESYLDKAADFAIEINQIFTGNMQTVTEFMTVILKKAWIGATVGSMLLIFLFTGPFVIFFLPFAMLDAIPIALVFAMVFGIVSLPLPAIRSKGVPHKDCEKILDIMANSRKNYEGWRTALKHFLPGPMPGQADFDIEGGKAEFDYHRSKQSMSVLLTHADVVKLHQIAGDILHSHRTPSDFRLNLSGAAARLNSEVKKTSHLTRGGFDNIKNRHGAFQEKDVGDGHAMIPIQISRYMAELADSLLDAVEKSVK